jgi:hypothetical protein
MSMDEYHGAHPKAAAEGHVVIDWSDPVTRCTPIRVRDHTCACLVTSYELCMAGGLSHIRRTERTAGGPRVSESPWVHVAEAKRLWNELLAGNAR